MPFTNVSKIITSSFMMISFCLRSHSISYYIDFFYEARVSIIPSIETINSSLEFRHLVVSAAQAYHTRNIARTKNENLFYWLQRCHILVSNSLLHSSFTANALLSHISYYSNSCLSTLLFSQYHYYIEKPISANHSKRIVCTSQSYITSVNNRD